MAASQWKFTLNDYTAGSLVATAIDEPVGWDAVNLHLRRDETWHGFFSFEDDSFSSLQYDNTGAEILRNAYYSHGVQARVELSVSFNCDGDETPDNLYLGTFDFTTFKDYTADRCYVECSTLVSEALYLFKNRNDQQVDLDSLASFDQLPELQNANTNAIFDSATKTIRVTQLLNGLMPGSKITIIGSTQNGFNPFVCTVASSKPDYTNVNVDLAGAGNSQSNQTVSATFDRSAGTIFINQLVNLSAGQQLNLTTATWPSGNVNWTVYDNSGSYNITSVQQFFNYTRLTVTLALLTPVTPANTYNFGGNAEPNSFMASDTQDTVVLTDTLVYTSLPTSTLITVAEALTDEASVGIVLVGDWLKNNMLPYSALGKIITVPSKVIDATTIWQSNIEYEYKCNDPRSPTYTQHLESPIVVKQPMIFIPNWPNIQSDIDETDIGDGLPNYDPDLAHIPEQLIYYRPSALTCSGIGKIKIQFSGKFVGDAGAIGTAFQIFDSLLPSPSPGFFRITVQIVDQWDISLVAPPGTPNIISDLIPLTDVGGDGVFSYEKEVDYFDFEPGQYMFVYFGVLAEYGIHRGVSMFINPGASIKLTISSKCANTPTAAYLINEAMSRCVESYTNGAIQTYSDYFGRKNAQPVASLTDGCGSLEAITNGLRLRGCTMPDGSAIPKYFTTLREIFTALDAIHNIGMGMETDPNRVGKLRLRVEPFEWFWQLSVLLTCKDIMSYTRELSTNLLPSTFRCGYQQHETWNNNGLYDMFGNRTYRTPLNHLTNELDKTCKWMASDYAIEFTRRQFGIATSDSRYDDKTFVLCLINKYKARVEFVNSCILIDDTDHVIVPGDVITVTGSANNNITAATVTQIFISQAPGGGRFLNYVFINQALTNEQALAVTITGGAGGTITALAAYFIGSKGAIVLDDLDLFNAQPTDTIVIGNVTLPNGDTYIIESIFSPIPSFILSNINYPMIIFPTTDLSISTIILVTDCTIDNQNNQFYAMEQGVESGTNILSPSTVMNYRISPAHAAMRHFRNVIADRQYLNESLIFTGGEGNFYALGQLSDSCSPENGLISEGGNLSRANFTDQSDAIPLFYPEIIKFEYPLTWNQFLMIQVNPYGLVKFEHTTEGLLEGWIIDLQYKPYTGMAEFSLYQRIT